ncbi:MAG TPA: GIY-YIG nuclease family protein [Phenylobacterium sp.]|jgi:hypothetical protein|nr:GIY-YIG nuclease family protein [Phenylobacterium sp.]
MDKQSRRQAARDYRERKVSIGIFAVRCAVTGEAWVGVSRDLAQQQNRVWFGLKTGGHPNRALQAAWTHHGETAFSFEVLEAAPAAELSDYERGNLLKARDAHWRAELTASKISG